jgi:hypothetical protein
MKADSSQAENALNARMRRDTVTALVLMLLLLPVQAAIWFPLLPNGDGRVSVDFSLWLPDMLAGYYWYLRNGFLAMPWFSPSQCAGIPFHADPQVFFLSLPQFLTFVMPPLDAVRCTFVAFAAAGYWGAWHLARRTFSLSIAASLLAAALFMLNGFFSVRMVVGHITYAPFMLTPAFAAAMLRPANLPTFGMALPGGAENMFRVLFGGLILAVAIQAGMVHIIPPMYLSLVAVGLIHALRRGPQPAAAMRLAMASLVGLALCAGKLAASLALLSQEPRDLYTLPGLSSLPAALYVALRVLFTPLGGRFDAYIVNAHIIQEQHEWEYGVGAAPLLLMLAAGGLAAWSWWRRGHVRPKPRPSRGLLLGVALGATLAVPLVLNLYSPGWNHVLKSLPFFGNSSNLLRWFCAWILPAIVGGACALESIAALWPRLAIPLAAAGVALMLLGTALADHTRYGPPPDGIGFYDPDALTAAWHRAHDSGSPPPITAVTKMVDANHQLLMAPERQNALTEGYSTLFCYAPMFGYRMEKFVFGHQRLGPALGEHDGLLNFKNPACYVFPGANLCAPGDQFTAAQAANLSRFLDYGPLDFAKPGYAVAADWLGLMALLVFPVLFVGSLVVHKKRQKAVLF